jgi:hypothetical protein
MQLYAEMKVAFQTLSYAVRRVAEGSQNLDWRFRVGSCMTKADLGINIIMKRQIASAACGLCLLMGAEALAETRPAPVVVELYTSQGCSSCPPADALLAELAEQPGVIALALHVDYWDYIGWKDQFAHPGFTNRQKSYAKAAGERMIYTPQMIVGGVDRVVGHEPEAVAQAIDRHAALASPVRLTISRQGDKIIIKAEAEPPLDAPAIVQLVGYRPAAMVDIADGENKGLAVEYRNIVTSWERIGEWSGKEPLMMTAPVATSGPVAVIVQREGPAEVLAAATLP